MQDRQPRAEQAPLISVIIPVLRESQRIVMLVRELLPVPGVEVVVSDGDPEGSTLRALQEAPGLVLLAGEPGRARQMNAGAEAASGRILLFLHADTTLPAGWAHAVRELLGQGFARCGAFSLRFTPGGGRYDRFMGALFGRLATLRSRLDRRPYGDQAQFFDADFFRELGGYPDQPLMEDVELMARAVRAGLPPAILPLAASTSARRYRGAGWLRRGLGNILLRLAYARGANPTRLARKYDSGRRGA